MRIRQTEIIICQEIKICHHLKSGKKNITQNFAKSYQKLTCPSGWMPCSRQYNSQQALPIWTPA